MDKISRPPLTVVEAMMPVDTLLGMGNKFTRKLAEEVDDLKEKFDDLKQKVDEQGKSIEDLKYFVQEHRKVMDDHDRRITKLSRRNTDLYAPLFCTRELMAMSLLESWNLELDEIAYVVVGEVPNPPKNLLAKRNSEGCLYKKLVQAVGQDIASPMYENMLQKIESKFIARHKLKLAGHDIREGMRVIFPVSQGCHYWRNVRSVETGCKVVEDMEFALDNKLFSYWLGDPRVQKLLCAAIDEKKSQLVNKNKRRKVSL